MSFDPDVFNELQEPYVDYTAFKYGSDLLNACNDDGRKWATAFCQYTKKKFNIDLDVDYVFGWMANIIEHSNNYRQLQREKIQEKVENP
jgi:hypothetical protein